MESKQAKFQWSIKLNNGEIYVVHADTMNDLILDRKEVTEFIKRFEIDSVPMNQELEDPAEDEYCMVHKVKMKAREGKYGTFYSHGRGEYPQMVWCSGKGFPDDK